MLTLQQYKQQNAAIQKDLLAMADKAEAFRNTATDELVSVVIDHIRGYAATLAAHQNSVLDAFTHNVSAYESEVTDMLHHYDMCKDMVAYVQRAYRYDYRSTQATRCTRRIPAAGKVPMSLVKTWAMGAICALQIIADDMSRYKKLKTDMRAYRLINDIQATINNINLAVAAYFRDDLVSIYRQKDFRNLVEQYNAQILDALQIYLRIVKFENITDYYN